MNLKWIQIYIRVIKQVITFLIKNILYLNVLTVQFCILHTA